MSEHQVLDLNQLATMTVADFREMPVDELVALARKVREKFPNMPNLAQMNPAYAEVLSDIEKKEKDSLESAAFAKGREIYDSVKASALGDVYKGFRMEIRETEEGLVTKISYLTSESTKRNTVKATSSSSKVLSV